MLQLTLSEKTVETQRKVVIEEYKQRYLNQPYGDVFHHLRDLAYEVHPYRWPTIGQNLDDIIGYTQEDVWDFYHSNYRPDNAILVVAGSVSPLEVEQLAKKWFEPIPNHSLPLSQILVEPAQTHKKTKSINAAVPTDALYKAYKMPGRIQKGYLEADLITDLLGFGKSSLLEQELVKKGKLFASIGAYVLGSVDPGLMIFSGKMEEGVSCEVAEKALDAEVQKFLKEEITDHSLQKVKNQGEAMKTYESIQVLNRAMNLAYYAHLGHPDFYWEEYENKSNLKADSISKWANSLIREENSSVLYYKATT